MKLFVVLLFRHLINITLIFDMIRRWQILSRESVVLDCLIDFFVQVLQALESSVITREESGLSNLKSHFRNVLRISNQFRKIEFWLMPPNWQPFACGNNFKKWYWQNQDVLNLANFRKGWRFVAARKVFKKSGLNGDLNPDLSDVDVVLHKFRQTPPIYGDR